MGDHEKRGPESIPGWLRTSIITVIAVLFVVHVVYDMLVKDYQGQGVSFMLGGIVGTAIGVNKIINITRGGDAGGGTP